MDVLIEPQFIELPGRRLFGLRVRSPATCATRVLVLPPFAEEMNKGRRLLALTAHALARRACDVLLADLRGTGDSPGHFDEASWADWCDDIEALARWHAAQVPGARALLLPVRTGILLASATLLAQASAVVAWQPVLDGERFLHQFLRVRVMAEKFAGRDESIASLLQRFEAGETIEVGGYAIGPTLAAQMRAARLLPSAWQDLRQASFLEIKGDSGGRVSKPVQDFAASLAALGVVADAQAVIGEQFWTTQDIAAPLSVVDATVTAVTRG